MLLRNNQAEDGIRDFCLSRGLGDVYKRQRVSEDLGQHNQEKQSVLVETITGIESIKVLGGGDLVKDRWKDAATKQSSRRRHTRFLPVSWARRCV